LMERDNTVKQAGGFIIQLMPFTEEAVIEKLEKNLSQVASVTSMLEEGKSPEDILKTLLDGFGLEIVENRQPRFCCNCGKERIEKALISVGKKELQEMIEDGETIEVKCHFCNAGYEFTVEELEEICRKAEK